MRPACSGSAKRRGPAGVQVVEGDVREVLPPHQRVEERAGRGRGAVDEDGVAALHELDHVVGGLRAGLPVGVSHGGER